MRFGPKFERLKVKAREIGIPTNLQGAEFTNRLRTKLGLTYEQLPSNVAPEQFAEAALKAIEEWESR